MRPRTTWVYTAFGVALVSTAGLRLLTWPGARNTEVDAAMAETGRQLFQHEWTPGDPLAGGGDGLGPVFNATSCVACHGQGGTGGAGSAELNVTTFTVRPEKEGEEPREGVVHAQATDRKSTRLNSSHIQKSRMPSSA